MSATNAIVPMTNEHPVEMGMKGHEARVLAFIAANPKLKALNESGIGHEGYEKLWAA